jgi:hypothetical protein
MTDRIVVWLPDGRALALEAETYRAALAEGSRLCAAPADSGEPLLDADQLAAVARHPCDVDRAEGARGCHPVA